MEQKSTRVAGLNQIRPDPEYTLSILPAARSLGVAGGKIEVTVSLAQPSGCPDSALRCSRCPGTREPRWGDIQGDDQTMIVAAIAVVTAERHEDATIEQCQRATLILNGRIETDAACCESGRDIDRKTRQHTAVSKS